MAAHDKEAKRLRQEMKQRGHVVRWPACCPDLWLALGFSTDCNGKEPADIDGDSISSACAEHLRSTGHSMCAAWPPYKAGQVDTVQSHRQQPSPPLQVPTKRGQDPAGDAREKSLQRLATRGVVRLFNAIAKAQKQLREAAEATGSKAKAAKLGRASFLAELKGGAGAAGAAGGTGAAAAAAAAAAGAAPGDRLLVPSAPGQAAAAAAKQGRRQRAAAAVAGGSSSEEDEEGAAGWDVLQKGFVGLQGAPVG